MTHDALTTFRAEARAAFGPLTTETIRALTRALVRLTHASPDEPWLRRLEDESSASTELHRDVDHGFMLLAHVEPAGLYRAPHDHGCAFVIYALARGEMEVRTYARVERDDGSVHLVERDVSTLREGEARVYLPGDIHDTRCTVGPSSLFRFTERDLRREDLEARRLTRYVERDGVFMVAPT